ncbi:MAG: trimethylamine methyltransferase family protein, partial [Dongiaceae bacterium]
RERRVATRLPQLPWREIALPYRPYEVLSADQVEAIHLGSLRVLEEIGMEVLHPPAQQVLKAAGADVDEAAMRVRFDRGLIESQIAKAPPEFSLRARNPARDITLGRNRMAISSVGGPAYISDLDRGRRDGSYADLCDFLKLVQSLNIIHQEGGGPVEPLDLPADTRHLDLYLAQITLLDKTWQGWALGAYRARDAIEMNRIALGATADEMARRPAQLTIVNTNSPLRLDIPMAEGLTEYARTGQAVVVTPFTLSGAMSPVTIAGALAQQNAEALAVIALIQMIRPGAPAVYGGFTSNVDMKSGAPAFGTPEYAQAVVAGGQLARRYNLPYRSSNVNASNAVDVQAAYESMMSLWAAFSAHTNLMYQAAGWLEGGLTASFEKLILDAEMLQLMTSFMTPMEVSEASLGLDAIRDVGPGGHFFGTAHTLERFEHAFYQPLLSDWRNFESWSAAGAQDGTRRANGIWKELLKTYEQPPLDPAIRDELDAYVARRKEEIRAGST